MSGFGLEHLKTEGAHVHPDEPNHGYWGDDDSIYIKQLCGYAQDNKLSMIAEFHRCRKPHLLRSAVKTLRADIEAGKIIGFGIGESK